MQKSNTKPHVELKSLLRGANFKKLLKDRKITKWQIHRDCRISYRTLMNWQNGKTEPSDELAIKVGKYLGLIDKSESDLIDMKEQLEVLQDRINRKLGIRE